jgi:hypothetical protein
MTPMSGPDPYAKPTNTQPPAAPISSLNDEIAGNLNPTEAPATPTTEATDATTTDPLTPPNSASNGEATSTIDVTGEPVDLNTTDETAGTGGRHRKRTRRGEPE